jgi:translation initiation factor 1
MLDWKEKLGGFVYSTNENFNPENNNETAIETPPPKDQQLILKLEKKGRGGKTVVIIENFIGTENACKELAKQLKNQCCTGGSVKDNSILIQGDVREKIMEFLHFKGYKTKKVGG